MDSHDDQQDATGKKRFHANCIVVKQDGDEDSSSCSSSKVSSSGDGSERKVAAVLPSASASANDGASDTDYAKAVTASTEASQQEEQSKKRMRTSAGPLSKDKVSHEQRWNDMYNRVVAFRNQHGHCLVPNRFAEDSQLGFWVSAQRRQYKLMQTSGAGASALTTERIRKLEEIGFQWSSTNPHHTPWETRYEELCQFVKKYGHSEVPIRWQENPKLSHWVSKQRHDFKLKKAEKSSRLTDEKVRLLNEVGFLWEGSRRSLKEKVSLETPLAETIDGEIEAPIEQSSGPSQQQTTNQVVPGVSSGAATLTATAPGVLQNLSATAASDPQAQANAAVPMSANTPVATSNVQVPLQALSGDSLAQTLRLVSGALAPQQPQQMVAALLFPLNASPSSLNSLAAALSPPPAPPQLAQPQVNNTDANSANNLVAQLLAPLLGAPRQRQQQPPPAAPTPQQQQPLESLQQQLPFVLTLLQQQQQPPQQPVIPQQRPIIPQQTNIQQPLNLQQPLLNTGGSNQESLVRAIQQVLSGGWQSIGPTTGTSSIGPAAGGASVGSATGPGSIGPATGPATGGASIGSAAGPATAPAGGTQPLDASLHNLILEQLGGQLTSTATSAPAVVRPAWNVSGPASSLQVNNSNSNPTNTQNQDPPVSGNGNASV